MQRFRIFLSFAIISFLIFNFTCASAKASEDDKIIVSLSSAIHSALSSNPMMMAAKSRTKASGERIAQARSGMLPQVYITESYQRTNNPMWVFATKLNQGVITQDDFATDFLNDPSSIENFNSRLWVDWPIFDGGRTLYGWRQANIGKMSSDAALVRTRQEVISQTIDAYTSLLLAKRNITVIEQTIETAKTHLKTINKRFENGMVVKSDVLRAKVHLAELDQAHVIAKSNAAVARATLNNVMGQSTDQAISTTTKLSKTRMAIPELLVLIDQAIKNRPDLKQIDFLVQMAESEIDKEKSGHWPSFNLNGSYELNSEKFDETADNYTIGANVTLNLFSGYRISSKAREALYKRNESKSQKKGMYQRVRLETEKAYYDLLSADKRITTSELAIDNAEEMLRIVENRYATGLVNIVSLLDAELALYRANNNYYNSLKDYVQARAHLALATGGLDEHFQ